MAKWCTVDLLELSFALQLKLLSPSGGIRITFLGSGNVTLLPKYLYHTNNTLQHLYQWFLHHRPFKFCSILRPHPLSVQSPPSLTIAWSVTSSTSHWSQSFTLIAPMSNLLTTKVHYTQDNNTFSTKTKSDFANWPVDRFSPCSYGKCIIVLHVIRFIWQVPTSMILSLPLTPLLGYLLEFK